MTTSRKSKVFLLTLIILGMSTQLNAQAPVALISYQNKLVLLSHNRANDQLILLPYTGIPDFSHWWVFKWSGIKKPRGGSMAVPWYGYYILSGELSRSDNKELYLSYENNKLCLSKRPYVWYTLAKNITSRANKPKGRELDANVSAGTLSKDASLNGTYMNKLPYK